MKTGLLLEGGAMRGLFTAGVLDAFLDAGLSFDTVVGVSAEAARQMGNETAKATLGALKEYLAR